MPDSLTQFLLANFQTHADSPAYGQRRGYRMEWLTYAQILGMASHIADHLIKQEIKKTDRVMLWGENSAHWVAAFLGCAIRGVIVVPMDHAASTDFASRVAQQVETKLWICSRTHALGISKNAAPQIPLLRLDDLPNTVPRAASSPIPLTREDVLQIVFTSGTTADPKGVVITHGNVLANLAPIQREMTRYLKYERWIHPVRFLNLLPLSHVFGQFLAMFLPPLLGGIVIFQEELKPWEIIDTIRRERISVLVTVPRVLQSLKQKIERDLEDNGKLENFRSRFHASKGKHFLRRWWLFRSIHRQFGWKFWAFICGGAALDAETEEFWGRLGYAAIQGYGLTETTSLISVNHPFKLGKGSIGKVLPGREVKLAEDGEILIRGAGVSRGYWSANWGAHNAAAGNSTNDTKEISDTDRWYHTGDIGALDDAGNLYFKGRKKEVIVTPAGLNIYPEDLEAALRHQPEVKDCVVVGIERDGNAEPCAVLVLRDTASAEQVVACTNQSLAAFQHIRIWVLWPQEDFPRTSTQKPRRTQIAEFAARQMLNPNRKDEANESPIAELIQRITGKTATKITSNANLDSGLGLSSLDRVELIGALEDRYQIDLGDTNLTAARTIKDVEKLLRSETRDRAQYHFPGWTLRWPVTWLRLLSHYLLMRPAMLLLGWPKIEGRENLDGIRGPLLVVCNHISGVDVGYVQTALPPRLRNRLATAAGGEALEALRTPAAGKFLARIYARTQWFLGVSLLNLFPLPHDAGFRRSFFYAGRAVDRGLSILVFPEGRHTVDGNINPFRAGVGLLANNLNLPVLPLRLTGLFEVKQAGKKFARTGRIHVRIGKPINFAPGTAPEEITRELQSAVEAL